MRDVKNYCPARGGAPAGRLRQRGHDDMSVARKIGDVDRMIGGTQKGPLIIRDEWG